jgi:serine phosphatase RsbU (regulator of sigma subunit)
VLFRINEGVRDLEPADDLERMAHATDADVVNRAFVSHNSGWTAVQASIFSVVNFALFVMSFTKTAHRYALLVTPELLAASCLTAWVSIQVASSRSPRRKKAMHPVAQFFARNYTDWMSGYYLLQFAMLAWRTGNEAQAVWGSLFPWLMIGFRLSVARRLALNLSMFAISGILFYLYHPIALPEIFGFTAPYALATVFGVLSSRRARNRIISEFSERRTSAREQLRMRDELRYARELQLSMLPETAPSLDWADVAGISVPATEVGGDYFDYIESSGCLAVICGDVAGHGMASGITLSALRGGLTLLRSSLRNPAEVLERLHEVVTESSRRRILVTITAVLFDPVRKHAIIANAGHPPVLVRRSSGAVEAIELFGSPLGVRRTEPVPQREVAFVRGDVFVMHTDGIYESTNDAGEQYGLDRLSELLAATNGSASEYRDAVLKSVEEFRANAAQQDDVTVVVVKIV